MKPKEHFLKNIIVGEDSFSLEERIFNGLAFFSALGWFLIFFGNLLFQYDPVLVSGNFLLALTHSVFFYLSRFLRITEKLLIPFAIYSLGALTFLWFTTGGVDGGAIFIFIMLISIFIVLIKKRSSLIILIFSVIHIIGLLIIEYKYPHWITKHGRIEDRFLDLGLSITVSLLVINILLFVTIRNYIQTNQKSEEMNLFLDEALRNLRKDLSLSRKIQMGMFSQKLSSDSKYIASIKYIPVSEVGGDIYSIEELKNGDLQIFLADATGHGVQGALITMLIYAEYLYCKSIAKEPAEIIKLLNDTIATKYRNLDVYFSCVIAHIHYKESKLLFASGGHIEQFLLHKNKEISTLKSTGNLVGFQLKSTYKQIELSFKSGDFLFLFTDGIVDEFDSQGRDYGIERFKQKILKSADKPLFQIISDVIGNVEKFLEYSPFQDDITILGVGFQTFNEKTISKVN